MQAASGSAERVEPTCCDADHRPPLCCRCCGPSAIERTEVCHGHAARRANLDHLHKQAKDLLRLSRGGDPAALAISPRFLPAASGRTAAEIAALARCACMTPSPASRGNMASRPGPTSLHVEAQAFARGDRARPFAAGWPWLYGGDVTGSLNRGAAARCCPHSARTPERARRSVCRLRGRGIAALIARTRRRSRGSTAPADHFKLPPLVAVTHSRLAQLPEFMRRGCARARSACSGRCRPEQAHRQPVSARFPGCA